MASASADVGARIRIKGGLEPVQGAVPECRRLAIGALDKQAYNVEWRSAGSATVDLLKQSPVHQRA